VHRILQKFARTITFTSTKQAEKHYDANLLAKGIPADKILKYGFAFEGKKCLIKKA